MIGAPIGACPRGMIVAAMTIHGFTATAVPAPHGPQNVAIQGWSQCCSQVAALLLFGPGSLMASMARTTPSAVHARMDLAQQVHA